MAELSDLQRQVIIRLKLDPSEQEEGYKKARAIQVQAQAEMAALDAERQRTRAQLESQYTNEFLQQSRQRVSELSKEMAQSVSAARTANLEKAAAAQQQFIAAKEEQDAIKQQLAGYEALRQKLAELNVQFREQAATRKEGQVAAGAFQSLGSGPGGFFEQFGNGRVLEGFTAAGALQAVGLGALGAGIPIAIQEIGRTLKEAAFSATEFAHGIELISEKTGISSHDLQIMGAVGKTVGLDLDNMVVAMRRFSVAMIGGNDGTFEGSNVKGAQVLKDLGIATKDTARKLRDTNSVLEDVAVHFQRMPDGPEKAAIAIALFGRSGLTLIPFLNKGKEGLQKFRSEFEPYTSDLSNATKAQEEYEKATAKLSLSMTNLKLSLVGVVEILGQLADGVATILGAQARADNETRDLVRKAGLPQSFELTGAGISRFQEIAAGLPKDEGVRSILEKAVSGDPNALAVAENVGGDIFSNFKKFAAVRQQLIDSGRGKEAQDSIHVITEMITLENRRAEAEGRTNDLLIRKVEAQKESSAQEKKAARDAAQATSDSKDRAQAIQKEIDKLREQLDLLKQTGERTAEEHRRGGAQTAGDSAVQQITSTQGNLFALQQQAKNLSGEALKANLEAQIRLTRELNQLEDKRQLSIGLHEKAATEKDIADQIERQRDAIEAILPKIPGIESFSPIATRDSAGPSIGNLPNDFFAQQAKRVHDQDEAGRLSLQQNIAARKALISALEQEFSARSANKNLTDQDIDQLAKLNQMLKEQRNILGQLEQQNPFGSLLKSLKEMSSIVGKFAGSGVFSKSTSEFFAGFDGLSSGLKALRGFDNADGKPGGVFSGIREGFQKGSDAFGGGALGAVGGIANIAGPIGQAISGITSMILPFFNLKRKKGQQAVEEVKKEFTSINKAYQDESKNLSQTIDELTALKAKAQASITGGKKGNSAEMQKQIDQIDSELSNLKKQQRDIIENFHSQLFLFTVPPGAQDVVTTIQSIAKELKAAAGAGASTAEQIQFLNAALDNLKTKTAQGLRTDANETLNLMKSALQLQQQKEDIIRNAADQERSIRESLGLAPVLTPAQQAAKQIAQIERSKKEQLQSIEEQQDLLKAQIDGRMQLFGWTQKDLDATNARAKILAAQVDIERQITQETIKRIQANQAFLSTLDAGKLPALPAGILPANFTFPAGSKYDTTTITGPITIQINVKGPMSADDAADAMRRALQHINSGRAIGLQ